MSELLLLALLVVIFGLNAFFVASEFALVRVSRGRIEKLAEEGDRPSRRVLGQLNHVDRYLAAAQVGITMTSIGIGFLGEPALARLIEVPLEDFLSRGLAVGLAVALSFAIVTSLHITLGEQVPKLAAVARADRASRRLSGPLELFVLVFRPIVVSLTHVSNFILRRFGIDPEELEQVHTAEDLKMIFARSATLEANELMHLSGVLHLHEQEARQVMTPVPAVVTVDVSETAEQALRRCVSSGHTRLVVTEDENADRIRGIVHSNSLARLYMSEGPDATIEPLVREAPIVPETKALDDLLAELQRQRMSMAVVIDEYGRTVGIVSIEDILEEVVGEIEDETDPRAASMRRLVSGEWFVRGHVSIADLEDEGIHLPVDREAYNSIGGYVFAELGRLPRRGDVIAANGYSIRVESVRENRIEAVRITPRDH